MTNAVAKNMPIPKRQSTFQPQTCRSRKDNPRFSEKQIDFEVAINALAKNIDFEPIIDVLTKTNRF